MHEDEITPWSNAQFSTLEMARQSKLLSHSNISSLKNILRRQPALNSQLGGENAAVRKLLIHHPTRRGTPVKQLGIDATPPLLRSNHRSIELSRQKLVRRKCRRHEQLHHEPSFSKLDSSGIESDIFEQRPARVSRVVMPQIINKSPQQIRNPDAWRDLTDEKIFRPVRRLGRQKRQDSIVLPKVKITLGSAVYRTVETN